MMIGMRGHAFGRMHDDTLCALREGVSPGMVQAEPDIMRRRLEG